MWFYDAITVSDGTVGGVATVLADMLPKLPRDKQPWWIKHLRKDQLKKELVKVITESYTACVQVQNYLEQESKKGRPMEEAYEDVRPLIEATTRAPMFPKPLGGKEEEAKAAEELAALEDKEEESVDDMSDAEEAFYSFHDDISREEVEALKASLKRTGAPHRCLKNKPSLPKTGWTAGGRRKPAPTLVSPAPSRGLRLPEEPPPSVAVAAAAPAATPAARAEVAAFDVREPLMLLGTSNAWSTEVARQQHRLQFKSSRKAVAGRQESRLRLQVPPEGASFRIVSADRPESFVLCPSPGCSGELVDGERGHLTVCLELGPRATGAQQLPCFVIEGTGETGDVDVRVSLSSDSDPQVWINEV